MVSAVRRFADKMKEKLEHARDVISMKEAAKRLPQVMQAGIGVANCICS